MAQQPPLSLSLAPATAAAPVPLTLAPKPLVVVPSEALHSTDTTADKDTFGASFAVHSVPQACQWHECPFLLANASQPLTVVYSDRGVWLFHPPCANALVRQLDADKKARFHCQALLPAEERLKLCRHPLLNSLARVWKDLDPQLYLTESARADAACPPVAVTLSTVRGDPRVLLPPDLPLDTFFVFVAHTSEPLRQKAELAEPPLAPQLQWNERTIVRTRLDTFAWEERTAGLRHRFCVAHVALADDAAFRKALQQALRQQPLALFDGRVQPPSPELQRLFAFRQALRSACALAVGLDADTPLPSVSSVGEYQGRWALLLRCQVWRSAAPVLVYDLVNHALQAFRLPDASDLACALPGPAETRLWTLEQTYEQPRHVPDGAR